MNINTLLDRSVPLLRRHFEQRVSALEEKIEELRAPADVNEAIKEITQQYSFADLGDFISTFRDSLGDAHEYSRGLTQHLDEVERKGENLSNKVASNWLFFSQFQEAIHRKVDNINETMVALQAKLPENMAAEILHILNAEIDKGKLVTLEDLKTMYSSVKELSDKVGTSPSLSAVEVRQIAKEEAERIKLSAPASAAISSGAAPANAEARLAALEAWATNTGNMLGIPFKKA